MTFKPNPPYQSSFWADTTHDRCVLSSSPRFFPALPNWEFCPPTDRPLDPASNSRPPLVDTWSILVWTPVDTQLVLGSWPLQPNSPVGLHLQWAWPVRRPNPRPETVPTRVSKWSSRNLIRLIKVLLPSTFEKAKYYLLPNAPLITPNLKS